MDRHNILGFWVFFILSRGARSILDFGFRI